MKILCLSRAPLDYKGGIPAYCLNLYSNKEFNIESYSYDLSRSLRKTKKRTLNNIKENIYPSQIVIGTLAFSIGYFLSILKNSSKFDVIHIQHPDPFSSISTILAKLINPKIKLLITWHADIYSSYKFIAPILFLLDITLYALSSKIIFFTPEHLKSSIIKNIYIFKKKVKLMPFCFDLHNTNIKHKKKTPLAHKDTINILSIGRLVTYKGYEYAIDAIANTDSRIKYKIVGLGPLEKKLQKLINFHNLKNRVFLMGEINEGIKKELLLEADIFLFPSISKSEAYGLVQLEAMANHLPIINTYLNNGVNYLAPENVAVTCKIKNSIEIYDSINKLITDSNFYYLKCNASFNNLSRFNYNKMISNFSKLLREI